MTKKILAVALAALLSVSAFAIGAFATEAPAAPAADAPVADATTPVVTTVAPVTEAPKELKVPHSADPTSITKEEAEAKIAEVKANMNDFVAYVQFGADKNNDGLTAETPRPNLGTPDGTGTTALLAAADGGTLVATGKLYIGSTYAYPEFSNTLYITSVFDGNDYKNPEPDTNPACAMKMKNGSILTFKSDVMFDDIILFNEHDGMNGTIAITNNSTLVVGENVITMKNVNGTKTVGEEKVPYDNPCHISFYVEEGSTLILQSGSYEFISGAGNVYIDEDVVIENALGNDLRYDDEGNLVVPPLDPSIIPVVTKPAPVTSAPATTAVAESEGGSFPVAIVIGIVAAVVVVAVVVVAVVKKKK